MSTEFLFRSVSGADDFVVDARGSAAANAAADALIYTLYTRQTGSWSKGHTPDFAHPDRLRTVLHALSRDCFKRHGNSYLLILSVLPITRRSVMRLCLAF